VGYFLARTYICLIGLTIPVGVSILTACEKNNQLGQATTIRVALIPVFPADSRLPHNKLLGVYSK
jgi:hypothetical protein